MLATHETSDIPFVPGQDYVKNLQKFGLELHAWNAIPKSVPYKRCAYSNDGNAYDTLEVTEERGAVKKAQGASLSWADDILGLFVSDIEDIEGLVIESVTRKPIFSFGFSLASAPQQNYFLDDQYYDGHGYGLKTICLPKGIDFKIYTKNAFRGITLLVDVENFLKKLGLDIEDCPAIIQGALSCGNATVQRHKFSTDVRRVVEDIVRYEGTNARLSPLYYQAKSYELTSLLLDYFQAEKNSSTGLSGASQQEMIRLEKVKEFLESDEHLDYSCDDLTKVASMNRTKLRFLFKKIYGVTISQYRSGFRMRKAEKLLRDTDLTISEIAYQLGYADTSSFIVAFKKFFNCSPGAMRINTC